MGTFFPYSRLNFQKNFEFDISVCTLQETFNNKQ